MDWDYRIEILKKWGKSMKTKDWAPYFKDIEKANPWFTPDSIKLALDGVSRYLDASNLEHWASLYQPGNNTAKTIGIIMAGNLPLVGFHDLICTYACGHKAIIKLSSHDKILLPLLCRELSKFEPEIESYIAFKSKWTIEGLDAVIGTGSDNTSRYLNYYYRKIPRIIRKNRTSVAVIRGNESGDQLSALGDDIFSHFGKGCRNVSKLYLPVDYDFSMFTSRNRRFATLVQHPGYHNNYKYQKALLNVQRTDHTDTGYSMILPNEAIVSPISVVYYEHYRSLDQLKEILSLNEAKIQCVASAGGWLEKSCSIGNLQFPDLWDYSDNIDTIQFLLDQ